MADEEAPSWLQENPISRGSNSSSASAPIAPKKSGFFSSSSKPATVTAPPATTHTVVVTAAEPEPPYKWLVKISVTVVCLGLSIMVAATGALGVKDSNSVNDTGVIFVGIYLIVFAAILFAYEMAQICPIEAFDLPMKRNFGFLYGPNGKGLYMLFMGILAFGLSTPRNLAIATGIVVAFFGCLICLGNLWLQAVKFNDVILQLL